MSRIARWLRNLLFVAVALGLLAGAAIYVLSERILRRHWDVPAVAVEIPADPAAVERGRHLAQTRGCTGCHGADLAGAVFFDEPRIARLVAVNLSRVVHERPVADLERAIRRGVRPDGTTVRGMPSWTYYELTDADFGALLAYLQSVPTVEKELPATEIRWLGRLGLALGKYKLGPQLVDPARPRRPQPAAGDVLAEGRYLARTMCVECHGLDLRGDVEAPEPSPNLALVASYTPEQFARLLRTGVPAGEQALGLMAEVARANFAHLSDAEIAALYQYLRQLADPSAQNLL